MPVELLAGVLLLAANTTTPIEASPSPELLEFLGSFTTDDGEWVDPQNLAEIDPENLEQDQAEKQPSEDNATSENASDPEAVTDEGDQT